jgi:WD40 repeat protein
MRNVNTLAAALFVFAGADGFANGQQQVRTSIKHSLDVGELAVSKVVFSPDGKVLAVACASPGEIRLYSTTEGRLLHTLKGHRARINCITFASNGRFFLSGGQDKRCVIWDSATNKSTGSLEGGHNDGILDISISPDGQRVVTSSIDGSVVLWDLENRKTIASLKSQKKLIGQLAHSRDGKLLAGVGAGGLEENDGMIHVWNAQTVKELARWKGHEKGVPTGLAFILDGKQIVTCGNDKFVKFWDTKTFDLLGTIRCQGPAMSLAVSPNGKLLAVGSSVGEVTFYNISAKARKAGLNEGLLKTSVGFAVHDLTVHTLAFRPDGNAFASCSLTGVVKIWIDLPEFD